MLPLLTSCIPHRIQISALSSAEKMHLGLLSVPGSSCHLAQPTRHSDQLRRRHHGLDVMYQCCCHDHHLGPIEMLREESPHATGSSFSHPRGNDEDITPVFLCLSLFLSLVVTLLYFSTTLVIFENCPFVKPINRP